MIKDYLGTGKPVVVEHEEIRGVPEGYEFVEIRNNNAVFDKELYEDTVFKELPYKIGSIDEYVCETCKGSGETDKPFYEQFTGVSKKINCPACKGTPKIKRKLIDITVADVGGKFNFEVRRVMI